MRDGDPRPPEDYRRRRLTESYWPADTGPRLLDWTLGDLLRDTASAVPERLALLEGRRDPTRRRTWTYAELQDRSERVASALLSEFAPGERIAVWAANEPEWQLLLYGCALAGITLVTANPAYKARELEYVLATAEVAGLFLMDEYRGFDCLAALESVRERLPRLREVHRLAEFDSFVDAAPDAAELPHVKPMDPCVIMFSSGTTGAQKPITLHHFGLVNMARFAHERGGFPIGGVIINTMPMFHLGAFGSGGIGAVARHATHVLAEEWDPELFMTLVARERGNYSMLVPTMLEALLRHPRRSAYDLSSLKNVVVGAALVEAPTIKAALSEMGCTTTVLFGQTEMHGVVTGVHQDDAIDDKAHTIGQALPHLEVKIAHKETGEILPLGEQGEICVRGYQSMLGYFGMEEQTAKTLKADGWLHSGDLGSMDERGFMQVTGRLRDMIIRGGENIYPREIENLLLEHPKVGAVAVVGVPDRYWGEQVGAVIIPRSPDDKLDPMELRAFCRAQLAAAKTPALWYFAQTFPLTETGKLQKFKLVGAIRDGALKAEPTAS